MIKMEDNQIHQVTAKAGYKLFQRVDDVEAWQMSKWDAHTSKSINLQSVWQGRSLESYKRSHRAQPFGRIVDSMRLL